VLSTCNRTEIYGVSDSTKIDLDLLKNLLVDFKGVSSDIKDEHFFASVPCLATHQLFSVAASIDSSVIGDSQILRQLRSAYEIARDNGFTGRILNPLFQRAFRLGKQTYTRSSIHDGAVSVSLAAVEQVARELGSLRSYSAAVIGAGEMAHQTAAALLNRKVGRLIIVNRTRQNAEDLLNRLKTSFDFDGHVIDFEALKGSLPSTDIIITSTGSKEPILTADDLSGQLRKTVVIDIAVPRDVDSAAKNCKNVILKDIDDLRSIVGCNREKRLADVPKVREFITSEMVDFLTWYYTLPLLPEYKKTRVKADRQQSQDVLRIKAFLNDNLSEIHALYADTSGDFETDLANHFALIDKLLSMKQQAFAAEV
jgi:glutamyl-tRNA reductase